MKTKFCYIKQFIHKYNILFLSILVIGFILFLYIFTSLGVTIIKPKYAFHRVNEFSWEYDLSFLDQGLYYFSAGKTASGCSLYFKDQLLTTNKSDVYRLNVLLGYPLKIDQYFNKDKLTFTCDFSLFYKASLFHWPVILPYNVGVLVHWFRGILGIILSIAFAVGILLISFSSFTLTGKLYNVNNVSSYYKVSTFNEYYFVLFGFSSLMYAVSQSYYLSVFFADDFSFLIDIILHHVFVWSYILLLSSFIPKRKIFSLMIILSLCFSVYAYHFEQLSIIPIYLIQNILFLFISFINIKDIKLSVKESYKDILLLASVVFSISHVLFFLNLNYKLNLYSNELLIVFLNVVFIYLRQKQIEYNIRLSAAINKIIRAINSNNKISDILDEISNIILHETNFLRVSSYLDAFLIGEENIHGKTFIRITDLGYRKPTILDKKIKFEEGRGMVMKKAISKKNIVFNKGKDQAFYLVIPIGNMACINLSDDEPRPEKIALQSKNNILQLLPFLDAFNSKLQETMLLPKFGINVIKNNRGIGMWEVLLGAIFVDVVKSSMMKQNLGVAFSKFLDYDFFPLLFNYVKKYSYPEFTRGDEVYFPVLADFLPSGLSVYEATIRCVAQISYFIRTVAPELCLKKGYPPVLLRVGVSAGSAMLHSDTQITTSGYAIDEAKRLQVRASPGEILVSKKLLQNINTKGYVFGSERVFLIKSTEVVALPFISGPRDEHFQIYQKVS